MILRTVQIVVQDWKLCPQKHAKLLRTPWASLTKKNRWVATGNTPHLDALFIRAAHKTAIYILEPKGTTMESFEPYAMVHRLQYFSQVYVTRSLKIPLPKCEPRPELLCDLVLWAVAWLGSVSAPRSPKVDPPFPKADVVMSPGNQSGIGSCFAQTACARCLLEHVNFEVGRDLWRFVSGQIWSGYC